MDPICSGTTNYHFSQGTGKKEESIFDSTLQERWEKAQRDGIFRYVLNILSTKVLDGRFQFLVQLNIDRAYNRRAPQDIVSMKQPFDKRRFNFLKIPPEEEIMILGNNKQNVIAINVSPIGYCHSLLLPERCKTIPQIITKYSLYKAVELFSLSSSPYLRVGYNSLCAHASVNHLHWHLYYLHRTMLLEYINLGQFAGPVQVLEEYPAKGFCIKYSSLRNIDYFVDWAFLIINYLQMSEIAHNVYITRAKINSEEEHKDLRIYIWARKSTSGAKNSVALNLGFCELFGHFSINNEAVYRDLTEEYLIHILRDTTEDTFSSVFPEMIDLITYRTNAANM